jgi:hypothetical protein
MLLLNSIKCFRIIALMIALSVMLRPEWIVVKVLMRGVMKKFLKAVPVSFEFDVDLLGGLAKPLYLRF